MRVAIAKYSASKIDDNGHSIRNAGRGSSCDEHHSYSDGDVGGGGNVCDIQLIRGTNLR